MKSIQEEAARWFARLKNAEPDHPDRGRFEAWLASSPAHAAEYAAIENVWSDFDSAPRLDKLADAMERGSLAEAQHTDGRRRLLKRGVLGLFLCTGAGNLAWEGLRYWKGLPIERLALRTGIGEAGHKVLPDGSHVTLGADAQLEVLYYRDRRVVNLADGDAIFDVVRDPARPFVVEGSLARATVLGTRFAVNRGEERLRVSVERGRVQVEDRSGVSVTLEAGHVAEVEAGRSLRRIAVAAEDGFAWHKGMLVFDNASLQQIAASLSRYRSIPVRVSGRSSQRITAVIQAADIDHFLQDLPSIAAVRVEHLPRETRVTVR